MYFRIALAVLVVVCLGALLLWSRASVATGPEEPLPAPVTPIRSSGVVRPQAAPQQLLSAFAAAKAERLLRDRLPCLGCHVLEGEGGRIGPDLSRVGERRSASYIVRMIRDPQRTVPGTVMPRIPMSRQMSALIATHLAGRNGGSSAPRDVGTGGTASRRMGTGSTAPRDVAAGVARNRSNATAANPPPAVKGGATASGTAYIGTADGTPSAAATDPPEPMQADGAARPEESAASLYVRYCAPCHGRTGAGDGENAAFLPVPPTAHANAAHMSTRTDDALFDAIYAGGRVMGRSHRMPPFGWTLERRQIRDLVAYLRELCGCQGPASSRDGAR